MCATPRHATLVASRSRGAFCLRLLKESVSAYISIHIGIVNGMGAGVGVGALSNAELPALHRRCHRLRSPAWRGVAWRVAAWRVAAWRGGEGHHSRLAGP